MLSIEVIYEKGVFRPLHPVILPEGARAEVLVREDSMEGDPSLSMTERARGAKPLVGEEFVALLDEVAAFPYVPHPDGQTDIAARHDEILYPKAGNVP